MNCNGGISSLSNANDENRESDDESKMGDLNDQSAAKKLSGPLTESNIGKKSLDDGNQQVPDFGNRNEPSESSGGTDDQNDQTDTHDPMTERTTDTTTDDREKKMSEKELTIDDDLHADAPGEIFYCMELRMLSKS